MSEMSAYAKAGSVAEETLSAFKTVLAFGQEKRECQRYTDFNLMILHLYI